MQETAALPKSHNLRSCGGLPNPPAAPLPLLRKLTAAVPSPLLVWQLLQLIYGYCWVMRLYNGESDGDETADAVLQAAPPLRCRLALRCTSNFRFPAISFHANKLCRACSPDLADEPPALSCAEAMLRSIETACRSPLLLAGLQSRALAVATLYDVVAVLQHGRPTVLCALADAQRILANANRAFGGAGAQGSVSRSTRRRWTTGLKKLDFFLSWANELPASEYITLHQLALHEAEQHRCALVHSNA